MVFETKSNPLAILGLPNPIHPLLGHTLETFCTGNGDREIWLQETKERKPLISTEASFWELLSHPSNPNLEAFDREKASSTYSPQSPRSDVRFRKVGVESSQNSPPKLVGLLSIGVSFPGIHFFRAMIVDATFYWGC